MIDKLADLGLERLNSFDVSAEKFCCEGILHKLFGLSSKTKFKFVSAAAKAGRILSIGMLVLGVPCVSLAQTAQPSDAASPVGRRLHSGGSGARASSQFNACMQMHPEVWAKQVLLDKQTWSVVSAQCQNFGAARGATPESSPFYIFTVNASEPLRMAQAIYGNLNTGRRWDQNLREAANAFKEGGRGFRAQIDSAEKVLSQLNNSLYSQVSSNKDSFCKSNVSMYQTAMGWSQEDFYNYYNQKICGVAGGTPVVNFPTPVDGAGFTGSSVPNYDHFPSIEGESSRVGTQSRATPPSGASGSPGSSTPSAGSQIRRGEVASPPAAAATNANVASPAQSGPPTSAPAQQRQQSAVAADLPPIAGPTLVLGPHNRVATPPPVSPATSAPR